jgi:hypothetical protein
MAPRDIAALMNTAAIPIESIAILMAIAMTGRTLGEQGAEVIVAVLGGQVAAMVSYLSQRPS